MYYIIDKITKQLKPKRNVDTKKNGVYNELKFV